MNTFTIKGEAGFISVNFDEVYGFPADTSHWGGYDTKSTLEIKSGNFQVKSTLWTSTGEIYLFFQQLKECNARISGAATYTTSEGNLSMSASYDNQGHVIIKGEFSEQNDFENVLKFEFHSDQSFIKPALDELELVSNKYGDMQGVRN